MNIKIAILGDYNPSFHTHHALNICIGDCLGNFKNEIECEWTGTGIFKINDLAKGKYSGLWIAPGSPYKNMENVICAIQFARLNQIPVLGNCGGFQHMIIEFARNVCGIKNASHEESDPEGNDLVISKLSCSLKGQEEELTITESDTMIYRIIGKKNILGRYFCSYGLNEKYRDILSSNGLRFTVFSPEGEVRAFELDPHPFFMGTLFQPALTSTLEVPDPVIVEFFRKCIEHRKML